VRAAAKASTPAYRSENAWTDLGLTLPIFLIYHLCVVFLPVHNAADLVTHEMAELAAHDLFGYVVLTLAIGTALVLSLVVLGRGHSLRLSRFFAIAAEGVIYAVALRVVASAVVGRLRLDGAVPEVTSLGTQGTFAGVVLSLGAGFYEELVFRVGVFAVLGRLVSLALFAAPLPFAKLLFWLGWSLASAAAFSAWHNLGQFGEPFALEAFVFRWVSGLLFTLIFALRGFAPAVWTHTLYDIWVLVL
jgi:hypothetical protein